MPKSYSHVQRALDGYFSILHDYLDPLFRRVKAGERAWDVARSAIKSLESLKLAYDLAVAIDDHWARHGPQMIEELRSSGALKVHYGTDPGLMVAGRRRGSIKDIGYARRILLYVDSLIVVDPLDRKIRARKFGVRYDESEYAARMLGDGLQMLKFESLSRSGFSAGLPPVILVPVMQRLMGEDEAAFQGLKTFMDHYAVRLASEVLGRDFGSVRELNDYLVSFGGDVDKLAAAVARPEFLEIPDADLSVKDALLAAAEFKLRSSPKDAYGGRDDPALLRDAFNHLIEGSSRIMVYHLWFCGQTHAEPITDSTSYWRKLYWGLEEDARLYGKAALAEDAKIVTILSRPRFKWLGNVPLKKLIRIREKGGLDDLRSMFREAFKCVKFARPEDMEEAAKICDEELTKALERHERELSSIRRRLGLGAVSVVSGVLSAIAPIYPPLLVFSLPLQIIGFLMLGRDISEFLSVIKDIVRKDTSLCKELLEARKRSLAMRWQVKAT